MYWPPRDYASILALLPLQRYSHMQEEEAEQILKAAEEACFDAIFEIHKVARRHSTSIVVEVGGVPVEKKPLTDKELSAQQAKTRKSRPG